MAQNNEKTAKRKKTGGRDFVKGQSGNPGGRPTLPAALKQKLVDAMPEAFDKLILLSKSADEAIAMRAICEMRDTLYGRPAQSVHTTGTATRYEELDDDELEVELGSLGIKPEALAH